MTTPRDVTSLTGADLFAALISDVPIVVDNRKARKRNKAAAGGGVKRSGKATPKLNGDARAELETLTEAKRLQRIVSGMPDREYKPIAIILMLQDTICLKCGSRHTSPFCEVPMLKLKRKRRDDSKATIYVRLDHRIPAIHTNLPRYIQRQERFTYTCQHCFEVTQKSKRRLYPY